MTERDAIVAWLRGQRDELMLRNPQSEYHAMALFFSASDAHRFACAIERGDHLAPETHEDQAND